MGYLQIHVYLNNGFLKQSWDSTAVLYDEWRVYYIMDLTFRCFRVIDSMGGEVNGKK